MRSELVDQASLIVPDIGLLINAVSQRVRQLSHGRPPQIDKPVGMRNADIALLEIIQGKIKIVKHEVIPLVQ